MCRNYFRHKRFTIELHLCKHGFKEGYETWTQHGERLVRHDECDIIGNGEDFDETDQMDQLLVNLGAVHLFFLSVFDVFLSVFVRQGKTIFQ
jgi:hypothetical protein